MKGPFALLLSVVFSLVPAVAESQSSGFPSSVGVGAHGYDWLIGSWSCTNSMPSAMGGPATMSLTAAHSANGSIGVHLSGRNFDTTGYVSYDAKSTTWWNPSALNNGEASNESTRQTGRRTVWTGTAIDPRNGTSKIRDTYTAFNRTRFSDVTEASIGGKWKLVGNIVCTKS